MKKGVTLSIVIVAIVVMLILISSASVVGTNAINTANFEKYKSNVSRVSDDVNEYFLENGELPIYLEAVLPASLNENFKSSLSMNNDINDKLYVVDVSKLNDPSVENGIGNLENQDVYLVAEKSQNVYYLMGYKYKEGVYYTK